ncbi:MAG: alpha/beta hydrolase [Planctomycetaceae bacterium]|nr:alpha/beta hydrolase [Planctomycetaceae bacterium]
MDAKSFLLVLPLLVAGDVYAADPQAGRPAAIQPSATKPDLSLPTGTRPVAASVPSAVKPATTAAPAVVTPPADDWAGELLQQDPLAKKTTVTAADLRAALADDKAAEFALERHFGRATLTADESAAILKEALGHKLPAVRRQAAQQLARLGLLDEVVAERLLEQVKGGDAAAYRNVVLALANCTLPWAKSPPDYFRAVLEALASDDPVAVEAAQKQIDRWGADAVPRLLELIKGDDAALRKSAAIALGRVVGPTPGGAASSAALGPLGSGGPVAVAKGSPLSETTVHSERDLDLEKPEVVRVFYGTNREVLDVRPDPGWTLYGLPVLFLFLLYLTYRRVRRSVREKTTSSIVGGTFSTALLLGASVYVFFLWNAALRESLTVTSGTIYGPRRDKAGGVHYGYCDVSIPPSHKAGEVERPTFGVEDEAEHVILRRTEEVEEQNFYKQVRALLEDRPSDDRNCFIFVHGYNVSFEKAAMRTAQIHYDLKFTGVPMFYSWPSRAAVRSYFSDRNEINYSAEHVAKFLLDAAQRLDAKRIHVIAHSMGADAVSKAIVQMGDRGRIFDQIVLAAPDVDADVFREQIAPRMHKIANRTTLYCSRNDWALHASYAFNDSVRLGDSSRGIVILDGMDTVDASDIDTDLLGHSYYGDCLTLLGDVKLVIEKNLPPPDRRLVSRAVEKLSYWTFGPPPPPKKS